MNNELITQLDDYVKVRVTEKRYKHIQGVIETATALAETHGADVEKAHIAACFHDACKNLDIEEMNMLIEMYEIGSSYIDNPQLAHSKLAAAIIKDKFKVYDDDIVNAISYHTTGREGMSLLEKIIYVADATEPNRTYEDAKRLNTLAHYDLDKACYEVAVWTIKKLEKLDRYLDEDTVKAAEWLGKLVKEKEDKESEGESTFLAKKLAKVIDARQGFDIVMIDIAEKASFADYFVIATASNQRLISAIADYCEDEAAKAGVFVKNIEGRDTGWILLDFGDVIVNIFSADNREKYNLEKIWSDCETVNWEA